ncbi:MAG TPA: hypothetical protein DEA08_01795 [Planctomycetes bacterium]|nr:hypothetical protein [Planctomycetota bacterium]
MRQRRAFSLLEVIVALGVLSIGATAAFALLVAAAAAGRRAEHEVNAALIAETVLNESHLDPGVQVTDYPAIDSVDPPPGVATPPPQPQGRESRYLVMDDQWSRYPDYRYDLILTPLPGPDPSQPWHFLLECRVRWSQKGRRRSALFSTVRLRTPTHLYPAPQRQ